MLFDLGWFVLLLSLLLPSQARAEISGASLLRNRCFQTVFDGYLPNQTADEIKCSLDEKRDFNFQEKIEAQKIIRVFGKNPWLLARVPHETTRLAAIYLVLDRWMRSPDFMPETIAWKNPASLETLEKNFRQLLAPSEDRYVPIFGRRPRISGPAPEQVKEMLEGKKETDEAESESSTSSANRYFACLYLNPSSVFSCQSALGQLIEFYQTGQSKNLGGKFLVPILTSPEPAKGARAAAKKLFTKWQAGQISGDLFSDIRDAYLESGYSKRNAEKWTWDLIFLSFVHGQNIGIALADEMNEQNVWTILSADLISVLAVYFDAHLSARGAKLYSLPPSVQSGCDNGKNYHFWIPAYAARFLREQGFSKVVSTRASFALEMGYQMSSVSYGREPGLAIRQAFNSPLNDKNRIDLAYGASGAEFGSAWKIDFTPSSSIDSAYEKLYRASENSQPSEDDGSDSFRFMRKWIFLMKPRCAF